MIWLEAGLVWCWPEDHRSAAPHTRRPKYADDKDLRVRFSRYAQQRYLHDNLVVVKTGLSRVGNFPAQHGGGAGWTRITHQKVCTAIDAGGF